MALNIELWENENITFHIPPATTNRKVTIQVAAVKSDRKVALSIQAPGDIKILRPNKNRRHAKLPDPPNNPNSHPSRPNLES